MADRQETIELSVMDDVAHMGKHISAYVSNHLMDYYGPAIVDSVLSLIAQKVAEDFVREHGPEILAKLDTGAIANLAIAQSGAAIRETLEKPTRLEHTVRLW